ncbi:MAG TPA: phosphohydrolase [Treponema sp.]|nr:phosphohydrolase [Treponema sp.]
MFVKKEISVYDFVRAISHTVDLASEALSGHHKKTAYIACSIALEMKMRTKDVQDIVLAAMLHDIGAFSLAEKTKIQSFGFHENEHDRHAELGYKLIKGFAPLSVPAKLIRFHHTIYDASRRDVPLGSYIIHLADRVAVLIDEKREILEQADEIFSKIDEKRNIFLPDAYDALRVLSRFEYFWIDVISPDIDFLIDKMIWVNREIIDTDMLAIFAQVLARVIDFRSRFTSTHSSGVAAAAREIAALSGFTERECKMVETAGFVHDLGKLAVPNEILEKNGGLTIKELNCIKKHTYYTYSILSRINGLDLIPAWAAFHHERLDGKGYPFHIPGTELSTLARIMAVADVITALTEDRPYRQGMDGEATSKTLRSMAETGKLDKKIVETALRYFDQINQARARAQKKARREYEAFHSNGV